MRMGAKFWYPYVSYTRILFLIWVLSYSQNYTVFNQMFRFIGPTPEGGHQQCQSSGGSPKRTACLNPLSWIVPAQTVVYIHLLLCFCSLRNNLPPCPVYNIKNNLFYPSITGVSLRRLTFLTSVQKWAHSLARYVFARPCLPSWGWFYQCDQSIIVIVGGGGTVGIGTCFLCLFIPVDVCSLNISTLLVTWILHHGRDVRQTGATNGIKWQYHNSAISWTCCATQGGYQCISGYRYKQACWWKAGSR